MTEMSSGSVVPAPELIEVALAASVLAYSNARGSGRFIDRRWKLTAYMPLSVAFLAAVSVATKWATGEDADQVACASELCTAFCAKPGESFSSVAQRLLDNLEHGGSVVFTARRTLGGNVKYYDMAEDERARRLIRETAKVYGERIVFFADEVERAFTLMRVFPSQVEEAHYQWQKYQQSVA